LPVADLWNDAGAGPWSQDDSQPDMLGFMLRGYNIPKYPKRLLPGGAFAKYTETGEFEATYAPIVDNPFFLPGKYEIRVLKEGVLPSPPDTKTVELDTAGKEITRCLDVAGATGAALDIRMSKGSYRVEVSSDGQHWISRLDTWCDKPTTRSVDLSFLSGAQDELVRTLQFAPPDDAAYLQSSTGSEVVREHSRAVAPDGSAVYRLTLPGVAQCHLEFLAGNNYRIDLSREGSTWAEALSPGQVPPAKGDNQKNAGWLRMVDATRYVGPDGAVFIRFRNAGNNEAYGNAPAFLRRVAAYVSYGSPRIFVRITGAPYARTSDFTAEWVRARIW
jgi:hypothetical protein